MTPDTLDPRWYLIGFCLRVARDEACSLVSRRNAEILNGFQPLDISAEAQRARALFALETDADRAELTYQHSHAVQRLADHRRRLRLVRRIGSDGRKLREAIKTIAMASDAHVLAGLAWWSAPNLQPIDLDENIGETYLSGRVSDLCTAGLWPEEAADPWVSASVRAALTAAGWADPTAWWNQTVMRPVGHPVFEQRIFTGRTLESEVHRSEGYNSPITKLGTLRVHADLVWNPAGKLRRPYLTYGGFRPVAAP